MLHKLRNFCWTHCWTFCWTFLKGNTQPDLGNLTNDKGHYHIFKLRGEEASSAEDRGGIFLAPSMTSCDIAHEERKTITDLINEGLDHVLTSRKITKLRPSCAKKNRISAGIVLLHCWGSV